MSLASNIQLKIQKAVLNISDNLEQKKSWYDNFRDEDIEHINLDEDDDEVKEEEILQNENIEDMDF